MLLIHFHVGIYIWTWLLELYAMFIVLKSMEQMDDNYNYDRMKLFLPIFVKCQIYLLWMSKNM